MIIHTLNACLKEIDPKRRARTRGELSENDEIYRLSEPEPYATELSDIYSV